MTFAPDGRSLFSTPVPTNSLWHTSCTWTILDLSREWDVCDKRRRNKLMEEKGIPSLLPWLIRQFSSTAKVSSRYKALMAVFAGLNYSLYVLQLPEDQAVEGLVRRDACERLHGLLFGLLGYFFKKLSGQTIFDTMSSKSNQVYEMDKSAETLRYVIQESMLAHVVGFPNSTRSLIARDSMASILKGWKNSLLMRPVMPVHSLEVLDGFLSRYLKSLAGCLNVENHPPRYHHILALLHLDILIMIPISVRSATLKPTFYYISDPVMLSAMVVCQTIKILLCARDGIDESLAILQTMLTELTKFTHEQDILGPQKKIGLSICEFVQVFSRFLERSSLSSSLIIDRKLQKEVIRWTQIHMEDTLLFRGILLPIFGQICSHSDNESAGFALIEILSQDTNLHSDISAWLVSNIKQSSSTTQLTFRSFCLSTLNQIYTQNRKYTELFHFLSSLIDDPSYAFRAQVAKCLGLYGFNYKFCSRRHARHTYDNTCSFHNPKKQNYPIELLSPYTVLLNYFDSILGSSRKCGKLERESLGLWSASATDHLLFECPLFGKHDPTYSRLKFQAFFASHLLDRYARLVGATPSKSCHSLRKAISSILCTFLSSSIHIQAKGLLISTLTPKDSKIRLIRHIRMDASWKVRLLVLNFILKVVQGFADKKKGHSNDIHLLLNVAFEALPTDQVDQNREIQKCLTTIRFCLQKLSLDYPNFPPHILSDDEASDVDLKDGRLGDSSHDQSLSSAFLSRRHTTPKRITTLNKKYVMTDVSNSKSTANAVTTSFSAGPLAVVAQEEDGNVTHWSFIINNEKDTFMTLDSTILESSSSEASLPEIELPKCEQNKPESYSDIHTDEPMDIDELAPPNQKVIDDIPPAPINPIAESSLARPSESSYSILKKGLFKSTNIRYPTSSLSKTVTGSITTDEPHNFLNQGTFAGSEPKSGSISNSDEALVELPEEDSLLSSDMSVGVRNDGNQMMQDAIAPMPLDNPAQSRDVTSEENVLNSNDTAPMQTNSKQKPKLGEQLLNDLSVNEVDDQSTYPSRSNFGRPSGRRYSTIKKSLFSELKPAFLSFSKDSPSPTVTPLETIAKTVSDIEDNDVLSSSNSSLGVAQAIPMETIAKTVLDIEDNDVLSSSNSSLGAAQAARNVIPDGDVDSGAATHNQKQDKESNPDGVIPIPPKHPVQLAQFSESAQGIEVIPPTHPFQSAQFSESAQSSKFPDAVPRDDILNPKDTVLEQVDLKLSLSKQTFVNASVGVLEDQTTSPLKSAVVRPSGRRYSTIKKSLFSQFKPAFRPLRKDSLKESSPPPTETVTKTISDIGDTAVLTSLSSSLEMAQVSKSVIHDGEVDNDAINRDQKQVKKSKPGENIVTKAADEPKEQMPSPLKTAFGKPGARRYSTIKKSLFPRMSSKNLPSELPFKATCLNSKPDTHSDSTSSNLINRGPEKSEGHRELSGFSDDKKLSVGSIGAMPNPKLSLSFSVTSIEAVQPAKINEPDGGMTENEASEDGKHVFQHTTTENRCAMRQHKLNQASEASISSSQGSSSIASRSYGSLLSSQVLTGSSESSIRRSVVKTVRAPDNFSFGTEPELPKKCVLDEKTTAYNIEDSSLQSMRKKPNYGSLWSISSKYEATLQQILRYLVFSNTKEKTPFSYKELLANGLDRGVFNSLSTLNKFLGEPRKPSANIEFSECLHIMLKRAFALDLSLLVDWSKTMPLGDPPLSQKSGLTPEESHWVHCLSQLHEHWLPLSRILFVMEADLKAALSVAQAIVLIKDQIALAQSTASQEILASEPGQMEHAFLDWLPGIKRT